LSFILILLIAEDPGLIKKFGRLLNGKSEKDRRAIKAARDEWNAERKKETNELLEKRQKTITTNQEHALKALEAARQSAAERQQSLDETSQKYHTISERLRTSSQSLENANHILGQLGYEKVDLVS
jgi:hypothetical protein